MVFSEIFLRMLYISVEDISVCTPATSSDDESSTGLKFRRGRRGKVLMDCMIPRIHGLLGEYRKKKLENRLDLSSHVTQ